VRALLRSMSLFRTLGGAKCKREQLRGEANFAVLYAPSETVSRITTPSRDVAYAGGETAQP
jgi:hypothetical protein